MPGAIYEELQTDIKNMNFWPLIIYDRLHVKDV